MKKAILAALLCLFAAIAAQAQNSTTVTFTITDTGGVAWIGANYSFQFVGPTNVVWPGGSFNRVVSGTANGSGAVSVSLPSTNTMVPSGTWTLQVTPITGIPRGGYTQTGINTTGGTQAITVTPTAISIVGNTPIPLAAYADAELVAPVPLAMIYYQVTGLTTGTYRVCQAVTNQACTTWGNLGGGAGTITGSGTANTVPLWTAATVLGNSTVTDNGTTVSTPEPIASTTDGVHAGMVQLGGNTTAPAIPSNIVGLLGPASSTFTSYALQYPSTAPSGTQYLGCGTPSSSISTCSFSTPAGTISGLTTNTIPKAASATTLTNSSLIDSGTTVTGTEPFLGPSGSVGTPTYSFSSSTTNGMLTGNDGVEFQVGGSQIALSIRGGQTGTILDAAGIYGFVSGHLGGGSAGDTGYSRCSANVSCFGNGNQGDFSGTVEATGFNAAGTAGITGSTLCSATINYKAGLITVCTASSDARLKTNVHPFVRGLADIMKLHPATYGWNKKGREITKLAPGVMQTGFLAQDVRRAIPEAVGFERHNGVDYLSLPEGDRPIVAALVNAVQEQQREIEQLKKEIQALKVAH
jgi:Chaperone of endosialidase